MAKYLLGVGLVLSPGVGSNLLRLLESLLLVSWLLVGGSLGLLGLLEGLLVEGRLLVDNCDEDKRSLLLKKISFESRAITFHVHSRLEDIELRLRSH